MHSASYISTKLDLVQKFSPAHVSSDLLRAQLKLKAKMISRSSLSSSGSFMTQVLRRNFRVGSNTMQGGRTFKTAAKAPNNAFMRASQGARPTNTCRSTVSSSKFQLSKSSTSILRSFSSSSRQFILPTGQLGPVPLSTRLVTPSPFLRQALKRLGSRQKSNFSKRARPLGPRKQPNSRQRFGTSRSKRNAEATPQSDSNDTGLTARMRRLSREYGWSALGVYFMLSALDFPFCYLLVQWLGTDRIGKILQFYKHSFAAYRGVFSNPKKWS